MLVLHTKTCSDKDIQYLVVSRNVRQLLAKSLHLEEKFKRRQSFVFCFVLVVEWNWTNLKSKFKKFYLYLVKENEHWTLGVRIPKFCSWLMLIAYLILVKPIYFFPVSQFSDLYLRDLNQKIP